MYRITFLFISYYKSHVKQTLSLLRSIFFSFFWCFLTLFCFRRLGKKWGQTFVASENRWKNKNATLHPPRSLSSREISIRPNSICSLSFFAHSLLRYELFRLRCGSCSSSRPSSNAGVGSNIRGNRSRFISRA